MIVAATNHHRAVSMVRHVRCLIPLIRLLCAYLHVPDRQIKALRQLGYTFLISVNDWGKSSLLFGIPLTSCPTKRGGMGVVVVVVVVVGRCLRDAERQQEVEGGERGPRIWSRPHRTNSLDETLDQYRMFPDLVKVVISPNHQLCMDDDKCVKNPNNPTGIPRWKSGC